MRKYMFMDNHEKSLVLIEKTYEKPINTAVSAVYRTGNEEDPGE